MIFYRLNILSINSKANNRKKSGLRTPDKIRHSVSHFEIRHNISVTFREHDDKNKNGKLRLVRHRADSIGLGVALGFRAVKS